MNLFYKSIIFIVTFFCLTLNSSAKGSGFYQKDEIKQKDLTIEVGVNQSIPIDYKNEVKIIYDEFCQKHRVSIDGDVVDSDSSIFGEALGTDNDSYAYFCKFVANSPILKTLELKERCSECKGSTIKYIYPGEEGYRSYDSVNYSSDSKPSILQPIKTDCRACNHTGLIDISVNFKIICKSNNIPKLPKTLRQREQLKIEELVARGDKDARTTYATQLIDSTPIVVKDLKKSKSILEELLVEGHLPALEQYLRVLNQDPSGTSGSIDIKKIFQKSSLIILNNKGGLVQSGNYLINMCEDILAKNIAYNLGNKTLKPGAFNASTVINDFKTSKNIGQFNEIEKALIPWVESNNLSKIDDKTLLDIKKLAQNLQPSAFYVLGTISENGMNSPVNKKAAYVFYICAERISKDSNTNLRSVGFSELESTTPTQEILTELSEFKQTGKCSSTFIDAIYNLN
jgi:TPR repeat protein